MAFTTTLRLCLNELITCAGLGREKCLSLACHSIIINNMIIRIMIINSIICIFIIVSHYSQTLCYSIIISNLIIISMIMKMMTIISTITIIIITFITISNLSKAIDSWFHAVFVFLTNSLNWPPLWVTPFPCKLGDALRASWR